MPPKKVIFVRLDKIGDLVSTMPMDEICRQLQTKLQIDFKWVISEGLQFLADNAVPKREYFTLSLQNNWKNKWKSFWNLVDFFKKENPSLLVIYYAFW